jgi:ribA/ribD-fused uncharacterized protein
MNQQRNQAVESKQMEISRFSGPYRFLSNFYPAPIIWEGIRYPTNEHAFQAAKTLDPQARQDIALAPTAALAKSRGRHVLLRPGWDDTVRYAVMQQLLDIKFSDDLLRQQLLGTGSATLVEGNTWHDMHWGVCTCPRHDGMGLNWLGRLLELTRAGLRQHV